MHNDITKTLEFYRTIFTDSPLGMTVYDSTGQCITANDAIGKIIGASKEQVLAQNYFHIESWKESGLLAAASKAAQDSTVSTAETTLTSTFEKTLTVKASFLPFSVQDQAFLLLTLDDRTEHKNLQKKLLESQKDYKTLFNEMLDGFALHEMIFDDKGKPTDYRFININPAFERLTGLKKEDVVGRTVLEVLPEIEPHLIESYGSVVLTGEPIHFEHYSNELKKHFEVSAFKPRDNHFACVFVDTTERKAIENQLRQSHKLEAIGTLAGGIAHDFNNILAAILGYADLAKDDIPEWSPARYQINEVLKAGNRAKELVRQILAFSRKSEQERTPLKVGSHTKEALRMLRASIPTTITFREKISPHAGFTLANPTQIHQVIINLCTNAAQAMEETGGLLTVTLQEIALNKDDLSNTPQGQPGKYIQLCVKDTGPGIEPENMEMIFDPYFSTKDVGKGSGLGLAVVQGILKSNDGFITVASQPGIGTTFKAYFPRIDEGTELASSDEDPLPTGKEQILVVDDETIVAAMTKQQLQRLGYKVITENSSLAALELFRHDPQAIDLVITDQTMPGLTGEKLARQLLSIRPDLPIILCTGYCSKIDEPTAKSLGIKAFAYKPLAKKELAETIRNLLDHSSVQPHSSK